jgi:hypothetical protein
MAEREQHLSLSFRLRRNLWHRHRHPKPNLDISWSTMDLYHFASLIVFNPLMTSTIQRHRGSWELCLSGYGTLPMFR